MSRTKYPTIVGSFVQLTMKIGIVSYICNPKSGARAPIDLALALGHAHEISFYAFTQNRDQETIERLTALGLHVKLFEKSPFPLFGSFFDFFSLLLKLRKSGVDVLSAHTTLSLLVAACVSGIPTVSTYYGTQFNVMNERFLTPNPFSFLINIFLNAIIFAKGLLLLRLPNEVVTISKFAAQEAKRLYGRSCQHIYLGSFPHHWKNTSSRAQKSNVTTLLSVSRITPYKQFEKVIEVVNKLSKDYKDIRLTIVGSAPQPVYLRYLKTLINPPSRILTNVSETQLISLYQESDIYATADKYLFFGMPVLEAAVFGKPTVAFNYGAANEMIQHGKTGFVANNQEEFEAYLKLLIENRRLRNTMGRAAKLWAHNFSWEKTAKEYIKVFENLLKKHG